MYSFKMEIEGNDNNTEVLNITSQQIISTENLDLFPNEETNNTVEEQIYINNYLTSHPIFAREWFLKNATQELIDEWLNVREGLRTTISCDSQNEVQSSDAKQLLHSDEELLTASYAEIAKGGRNSVTTELFQEIVGCGSRKKNNSVSSAGLI
jgi:hypothetical protein